MFFRWKKGLPNQGQGRKFIPTSTVGGVEMIPGKIYKFEEPAASVVRDLYSVEELGPDDAEVLAIFGIPAEVAPSDVLPQKGKKIVSVAENSEALPDLELLTKNAPAPLEPSVVPAAE